MKIAYHLHFLHQTEQYIQGSGRDIKATNSSNARRIKQKKDVGFVTWYTSGTKISEEEMNKYFNLKVCHSQKILYGR